MAEDLRRDDPADGDLTQAKAALVAECAREEENALYTSTNFFIWLRFLKAVRALLWALAALGSALAASHILRGAPDMKLLMAAAALAGVLLPGLGRALRLDAAIRDYTDAAARFKNLQGEFRRAHLVWSNKPFADFEAEARKLFKAEWRCAGVHSGPFRRKRSSEARTKLLTRQPLSPPRACARSL